MPTLTLAPHAPDLAAVTFEVAESELLAAGESLQAHAALSALLAAPGRCVLGGLTLRYPEGLAACQRAYSERVEASAVAEHESLDCVFTGPSMGESLALLLAFWSLQLSGEAKPHQGQQIPTEALTRYARLLAAAGAPYFLRYLLLRNGARTPEAFELARPILEASGMSFTRGHTQQHRYAAIEQHFPGGAQLVDVGCGPAYYLRRLGPRYKDVVGFEADAAVRAEARRQVRYHKLEHVRVFGAFDEASFVPAGAHVLMTEVLEHMPRQPADRMVFTVPNAAFNPHYGLAPGESRHPDHYWEPTADEFEAWMRELLGEKWELAFEPVGDAVDGVASGVLCLATRRPVVARTGDPDWLASVLSPLPARAPRRVRRF